MSIERVYVVDGVAAPFLRELTRLAEDIRLGLDSGGATRLGPLVDRRARDRVHEQVRRAVQAGATLHCGGVVPDGPGAYYPATVLSGCTDDMAVMWEATFGPVAPVRVVPSFAGALDAAARSAYGLAATVLTTSMRHAQQAWRTLPVGTVKINNVYGGAQSGAAHPRGASGQRYGRALLDEFTATKVVHLGLGR
jgi:succinate-semialdehyde dehydrogenase/glutarate-semialdehyde dehydrogenase